MVNGSSGHAEKIFVSVRMRPLNGKEIVRNDVSDWECINDDTIIFKNNLSPPDRSVYPTAYTFDRVFGCNCSTREVYEDGVKEVAFSVVSGINSSIFAYGQTSSGKTYTMTGITEYTMADIYKYIENHNERKFFLRFSAMEIYNESVRDLLSSDSTPLRLLDDPERGTTVEKLTEETLKDWNHLKELLSHCEDQRVVGETSLNETSSRSHQILRLTLESSARNFLGHDHTSTLTATVNFVDLAGSERASQSLSAGSRLKEGCHINRSLLTLGTVIRKLSKGRSGHVPFRDSKLTRILHSSLDGNARTAIICTMCPARSHVEQSRNTLLFGSCAKEVTTNAQVNVVVSDKALVKHLQRELAKLENELRISGSHSVTSDSAALLREKDLQIEELKKEMTKLILQRDLARSQAGLDKQYPKLRMGNSWDEHIPTFDVLVLSESHSVGSFEVSQASERHSRSNSEAHYLQFPDRDNNFIKNFTSPSMANSSVCGGTTPSKGWDEIDESREGIFDDLCKEVLCVDIERSSTNRNVESKALYPDENPECSARKVLGDAHRENKDLVSFPLQEDIELSRNHPVYDFPSPDVQPSCHMAKDTSSSRCLKLSNSRSCNESLVSTLSSRWFEKTEKMENYKSTPPIMFEKDFDGIPEGPQTKGLTMNYSPGNESSRNDPHNMVGSATLDVLNAQNVKTSSDKHDISISAIKKKIAMLQSDKSFINTRAQETESETEQLVKNVKDLGMNPQQHDRETSSDWPLKFKMLQKEIIELWGACNISLVHRTYFFLLIKGDLTDAIYMEVELRRLSFLKETFSLGNQIVDSGGATHTLALSMKALRREREMLSKKMLKRLSEQERESLYQSWGIGLRTKNRRSQLAHRLWNETNDMNHINESANIVAKLVSFIKPQEQAYKEMFELSFKPRRTSFSWKRMLMSIF